MSYAIAMAVDDSSQFLSDVVWRPCAEPEPTKVELKQKSAPPMVIRDYRDLLEKEVELFRQEVELLIERWTNEVEDMSSFSDMILHEDYQTIIAKGSPVIPILLNELRYRPHYWFDALHALIKANTGIDVDPVNEEDRGNLRRMANAWIAWGEENDYI